MTSANETTNDAIITPAMANISYVLPPLALFVSTFKDFKAICLHTNSVHTLKRFYLSQIHINSRISIIGPMMGAPYAAFQLENSVACGVQSVIYWGWCGAVAADVEIGDIIIPTSAFIDEGTSPHYRMDSGDASFANGRLQAKVASNFRDMGITYHQGPIWTTDAPYRETHEKLADYQKKGALAVEMETSALFSVGNYRNVEIAAVLVVSDDISKGVWKKGFTDKRFQQSREIVMNGLTKLQL